MVYAETPDNPAFPTANGYLGLTKREYFAAIALQGLLCNGAHQLHNQENNRSPVSSKRFTEAAVEMADALIDQLNK